MEAVGSSGTRLRSVAAQTRLQIIVTFTVFLWYESRSGPRRARCAGFEITLRHTTLGSTPLDEGPAGPRDLHLTTHNTCNRQTSMSPAGFEPAVSAGEQPQTHALDRGATGIGSHVH